MTLSSFNNHFLEITREIIDSIRNSLWCSSNSDLTRQGLKIHFLKCDNFLSGFPFGPHLGLDSMMHSMGPTAVSSAATNGTANANPDPSINVSLENEDLWKRFHEIGTEMIITKMGR